MTGLAVKPPLNEGGDSPRVFIVHGAMDRAATFGRVRTLLEDLPVITYDRRGYGGSRHQEAAADLSRHVADLLTLIGSEPAVVVGHSFGGLVALGAAAREPSLVPAVGVYEPPQPWRTFWPDPPEWGSEGTAAETFFSRVIGEGAWDAMPPEVQEARRLEGRALIGDYAAASAGLPFDLGDVLSPVGAAYGSQTQPHFRQGVEALCTELHGAVCTTIDGASHGAHLSHPPEFASWVRSVAEAAE